MIEWYSGLSWTNQVGLIAWCINIKFISYFYKEYKQIIAKKKFAEVEKLVGKMS